MVQNSIMSLLSGRHGTFHFTFLLFVNETSMAPLHRALTTGGHHAQLCAFQKQQVMTGSELGSEPSALGIKPGSASYQLCDLEKVT